MTAPLGLIAEQDFAGRQTLGKRSDQEDAYAFSTIPAPPGAANGLLLIVADGMGGHTAGNRASELAVRTFVSAFHRGGETMSERFNHAIEAANNAIAATIEIDPEQFEGMGTTLLAVAVTPIGLEWASVGDSPLYLFRRGTLRRINADHSFRPVLREMVTNGELTEEQAATSSLRNRLRSALIGSEIALVDLASRALPLLEGDVALAGSDGLQTLSDAAIAEVLEQHNAADAATIATRLVEAVMRIGKPKQDNVTAAVVKPNGDWLAAPFGFAAPRAAREGDDAGNATLRVIPRAPTTS
jgi:PPM family protein phosphatase